MRSLGDIGDIKAMDHVQTSVLNFFRDFSFEFFSRLYFAILHCFAQVVQLSAWILRHLQKRFWTERSHRNNFPKQRERRGFSGETDEEREARQAAKDEGQALWRDR